MKKIIIAILSCTVLFSVSSCKGFFETTNDTIYSGESVFENIETARMAIYGVYNMISNAWSKRVSCYFPVDNDCYVYKTDYSAASGDEYKYSHYILTTDFGNIHDWHYAMVRGYVRGTMCLDELDRSGLLKDPETMQEARRLRGEALVMRSVIMLQIVNIWGDVPFDPRSPEVVKDFELPKTDYREVLDALIADLEEAVDLLPWFGDVPGDERCTKGSALGYLARVCMYRAGYALRPGSSQDAPGVIQRPDDYKTYLEKAKGALETLIKSGRHKLNPSFYDHFKGILENKYDSTYGENLLEIAWVGTGNAISGEVLSYMGPRATKGCSTGFSNGNIMLTPKYILSFDRKYDTRFAVQVAPYSIDADDSLTAQSLTTTYDGKWRRSWAVTTAAGTSSRTDVNWPLMRYSDALLLYAEVLNELNNGPTADAVNAYEQVRKRAYKGNEDKIGATPTSHDAFFEAIVNERAWELGCEAWRKYDLYRWGRMASALQSVKTTAEQIRDHQGEYADVPDYVWIKLDHSKDNYLVDIAESDPGDPTYQKVAWAASIDDRYFTTLAINTFESGKNELYPYATKTLAANPKLVNYYGYGE